MSPVPAASRFDLSGKVALVTGGSRGLGRQMVLGFAEAGADVVVASRKLDACQAVAAEVEAMGRRALPVACNVGHWDELEVLADAADEAFGRIDVLVNNAGMSLLYEDVADVSEAMFDKVVALNLKGVFRLTALVGTRMVAAGGGSVINVSSVGSIRPSPDNLPYAAAKAGVNTLTAGFARTLGPTVRVNCIMAGPFMTDVTRSGISTPSSWVRNASHSNGRRTRGGGGRGTVLRCPTPPASPPVPCCAWTAGSPKARRLPPTASADRPRRRLREDLPTGREAVAGRSAA